MIKRIVLALTFAAIYSGAYAATYKDGTYTGEGNGNASKIQVEVVRFQRKNLFRQSAQAR